MVLENIQYHQTSLQKAGKWLKKTCTPARLKKALKYSIVLFLLAALLYYLTIFQSNDASDGKKVRVTRPLLK